MTEYTTVDRKFKGNVGIFLVAAKFSGFNQIALTTSRNTKGYDIVVLNPETNRGIGLQVKCTDKKDFPICTTSIKNFEKEFDDKIVCDFVLVDISSKSPTFFIVPKDDLLTIMKDIVKKYIAKPHPRGVHEVNKQLWTINMSKLGEEMKKYENGWEYILKKINQKS